MQTTSETYKTLLAKGTNVTSKEVRATIGLDEYYQDQLVEVKTTSALMTGDNLIGNCIASTLDIKIRNPNTIPRMAQIDIEVRLDDGETQSEWLPKGTYFIDTRAIEDDVLHIVAYDAMLKTEQSFTQAGDQGEWPRTDIAVVKEIAYRIGLSTSASATDGIDSRTLAILTNGYAVQYPGITLEDGTPQYSTDGAYSMREVLGFIGAMYGGNWCLSDAGKLRLVVLNTSSGSASIGQDVESLEESTITQAISKVVIVAGTDENGTEKVYVAGTDTGYKVDVYCPWATQIMANNLLTLLSGYVYRSFVATGALLNPAVELGDTVTINGTTFPLESIDTTFDSLYSADISAPYDEEVDHEYPYQTKKNKEIKREAATITASLRVGLDTITAEVLKAATWDEESYSINYYGFSNPDVEQYPPADNNGKYYLNKTNGKLYLCNGSAWNLVKTLTSISQSVSTVRQTADKISWIVASGTSSSNFTITSRMASLVAGAINLTGYVTFHDLSTPGETTIVGNNINSGTIKGVKFITVGEGRTSDDSVFYIHGRIPDEVTGELEEVPIGYISYDSLGMGTEDEKQHRLLVATHSGYPLKLESGDNMSIKSAGNLYIIPNDGNGKLQLSGKLNLGSQAWGRQLPVIPSEEASDNYGRLFFLVTT